MNEEKNADGTARLRQDGSPRKPHYDVTVSVKGEEHYVDHVIRVYDSPNAQKSNIETMKRMFGHFNKESNRISVTFVTTPGQERSYVTMRNGNEYTNFVIDHMGYKSMDVEYLDQREKTASKEAAPEAAKAPAQTAQAPVQEAPVQETPAAQAPVQNGFTAPELDLDAEKEFI
jgi:hypothetical protein